MVPWVLLGDDPAACQPVQSRLGEALGIAPVVRTVDECLGHGPVWPRECWFFAPALLTEVERACEVVRTARLEEWPVTTCFLVCPSLPRSEAVAELSRLSNVAYRWPDDLLFLATRFRDVPVLPAIDPRSPVGRCRRLLRRTPWLERYAGFLCQTAAHDVLFLMTGETGTGKTFLARALHDLSPRSASPFLVVSCGSLPAGLAESAFFGHVRGAFTGADRTVEGKFEAAGEGTILLDEVDTLGIKEQAALLRVVETGEFEPLGSHETRKCRARLLVTANVDLEEAIRVGRFREDLYYRLNALTFHLPPLRERREDIAPLARAAVARLARQCRKRISGIHPDVLAILMTQTWPGNLRQLHNVLQHAVIVCNGDELQTAHLPESLQGSDPADALCTPILPISNQLASTSTSMEQSLIRRALESSANCRVRAARLLGISRVTLYKKLKKYGLEDFPFSSRSDAIG